MSKPYNPLDWYWAASDGRVFGSRRAGMVATPAADADYQAWIAGGFVATPWPRDLGGIETAAALSAVTEVYGIFADLTRYAADKRWRIETGGIAVSGLSVPTDDRAKTLINGGASALADGDTIPFKTAAGWVTLTGVQLRAIRAAIAQHVQACFSTEAAVVAAIAAGTVTTIAAVDAASWPANG